jgi:xanthine dehydrogenase YagR molybdenum-binding subunit
VSILEDAKKKVQGAAMAAMQKAVELAPDSWVPGGKPDPLIREEHDHIGKPVSRIDGPLKVKGAAPFAAEVRIDRMVYAALAYSTIAKGRITVIDTTAADAAPGVVLVMTHRNAPILQPPPLFLTDPKAAAGENSPVMQNDRVYWNGQPIAIAIAETQEQADHAASLIRATYEAEPAATVFDEAKTLARVPDNVLGQPAELKIGDAEAALAAAPYKIDATYRTPLYNHNTMEPHAATLTWKGDELTIHDSTQGVANVAWSLAQVFGIKESQVHVTSPYVGGGFGCKLLWQHQILAAAASRLAGRPVRVALSREGVYRVVGGRALTEQRVAIGAQADGRFDALIHTGTASITTHSSLPEPFTDPAKCLYSAGSFELGVRGADIDMLANTFMRAPGDAPGSFALECAIDELAERLGIDPIQLRVRNEPEKDPTTGKPFSSRHLVEAYRAGAERFGWEKRDARPGARREGEWLLGVGVATASYPYSRFPGGAARITLSKHGHATVEVAAHEMGMGTSTVQTQISAERLGLPMEQVTFAYGNSSFPGIVLAAGSQQTASIGAAVIAAHRALVTELLKLVGNESPLTGLKPDQVGSGRGGLCKLDEAERYESYTSILARAQRDQVSVEAKSPPPLETMHWSMHSFGAQFCEVRVSAVTDEVRISRFLGSFDCGRILNPKTAASQFRGGIIMGLGMALMEETQFDERDGRIMNPNLAEYHMPVHMDVPEIDVIWTDIPDPHAPMGAHGVGEIGITGAAAAVANAIYNATGKRVRDLPITLDKLQRVLPDNQARL